MMEAEGPVSEDLKVLVRVKMHQNLDNLFGEAKDYEEQLRRAKQIKDSIKFLECDYCKQRELKKEML